MINSIEIHITGLNKDVLIKIDPIKKVVITPSKEYPISEEKIDTFLRIIRIWKKEYIGNIIDGERFTIKIIYNNQEEIIKGSGAYPDNYLEFKHFLEEYYDWYLCKNSKFKREYWKVNA